MTGAAPQANETGKSIHHDWVDFLRVFGTYLVVLAHIGSWGDGSELADALYFSLSRNGVPLFFMISGFLLLPKQEDLWTFFKKRAWKILLPFLVWSIFYDVYSNQALAESGLTLESVFRMSVRILRGPRASHLWYLYALIGLYLFTPILRLFVAKARQADLLYYVALWFITVPILIMIQGLTPIQNGIELAYFTGYVGYFLMGLVLGQLELKRSFIFPALGLFSLGLAATFFVRYLDLLPDVDETVFRSYYSLNVVVMALSSFILLRAAGELLPQISTAWLGAISRACFGIYLIHWLIVGWMAQAWQAMGFSQSSGPALVAIPLAAVIAFLISFLITSILRRIPVIRLSVP